MKPFVTDIWKIGSTLNYIDIMQPVYFNKFLHANVLQFVETYCKSYFSEYRYISECIYFVKFVQIVVGYTLNL